MSKTFGRWAVWRSGCRSPSGPSFVIRPRFCGLPVLSSGFTARTPSSPLHWRPTGRSCFGIGVLVVGLTTLYMSRLVIIAFLGESRSEAASHAADPGRNMTLPLLILAVPSVSLGWLPWGAYFKSAIFPERSPIPQTGLRTSFFGTVQSFAPSVPSSVRPDGVWSFGRSHPLGRCNGPHARLPPWFLRALCNCLYF